VAELLQRLHNRGAESGRGGGSGAAATRDTAGTRDAAAAVASRPYACIRVTSNREAPGVLAGHAAAPAWGAEAGCSLMPQVLAAPMLRK
jgi:hypothetical protein